MSVADSPILSQPEPEAPMVDAAVVDQMSPVEVPQPEGVEVAGMLGDAIGAAVQYGKRSLESAEARTYPGALGDENTLKGPGGQVIIKAMPNEDLQKLNQTISEGGFDAGLNMGRIGEIFDEVGTGDFNLDRVLTNIKQNNADLFNYLRRDKRSMDDLMRLANATGHESIMYKFLNRNPGDVQPPEEVLAGMVGVIKMGQEIEASARAVRGANSPEGKAAAFKKMRMLASLTSNLAAQVSGNVSEYGRGLAVIKNISKLNLNVGEYAEQLDRFVADMDDELYDYHAEVLLSLQSPIQRAKYAEKGIVAKTYDLAMENYINALLSGPQTHIVNTAGNFVFQIMTLAERGLAGAIGNIRTAGGRRGEVGDQVYMGEAMAEASGFVAAQGDAIKLMAKTFVTGESSDMVTKLDLREQRALGSTDNLVDVFKGYANGDFFQSAKDTLGVATRMSGRFLATEDEYFKVLSRRRVLYREAHRSGQITYQNARKAGLSIMEAKAELQKAVENTINNPTPEIKNMMTAEARKLTFQGQPEGFMGRMGPFLNEFPLMKIVAPFYNTPTNIINEAFDRTLNWSPLYKLIKGDITGPELDTALAKLALGNSVALTMYGLASGEDRPDRGFIVTGMLDGIEGVVGLNGIDYKITGSIGNKFESRANIAASAGVPPYSVGIWSEEKNTYEWTSFARLDPLSALLAMGADMSEYMRYAEDPDDIASIVAAYTLSVAEYAEQMPFLQGVSELASAIGDRRGTGEDFANRMLGWLGEEFVGNVGTNVLGNVNQATFGLTSYMANLSGQQYVSQTSLLATLERLQYPERSSTKLPAGVAPGTNTRYTDTPTYVRGFYEALQRAKARNPFFSEELPPKLNFWAEPMYAGGGTVKEAFNPLRTSDGELSDLDEELIRLTETGIGKFGFHSDRVGQTKLNADQYNMLVKAINGIDEGGLMAGETFYDATETLKYSLEQVIKTPEYTGAATDDDRFDMLQTILLDRRSRARKWMTGEGTTDGNDALLDALRGAGAL